MQSVVEVGSGSDASGTGGPGRSGRVGSAKARLGGLFHRPDEPVVGGAGVSPAPAGPAVVARPSFSGTRASGGVVAVREHLTPILVPAPVVDFDLPGATAPVLGPLTTTGSPISLAQAAGRSTQLPGIPVIANPVSGPASGGGPAPNAIPVPTVPAASHVPAPASISTSKPILR